MRLVGEGILTVSNVSKVYTCGHRALDQVSFQVKKGECIGIIGESGSGKSTLAKCILSLEKMDNGEIWLNDKPIHKARNAQLNEIRSHLQAVFQNPSAAMNPKLKVIDSLMEPLDVQKQINPGFLNGFRHDRTKVAAYLLDMVGLPSKHLYSYPHELSGGQKQRVIIARALSIEPELIILDEPTASLDVSVQAKILNLLKDLQDTLGCSYLFISHDLAAVNFMSERILVMTNGRIVDQFHREDLFARDRHPYTKELLTAFDI